MQTEFDQHIATAQRALQEAMRMAQEDSAGFRDLMATGLVISVTASPVEGGFDIRVTAKRPPLTTASFIEEHVAIVRTSSERVGRNAAAVMLLSAFEELLPEEKIRSFFTRQLPRQVPILRFEHSDATVLCVVNAAEDRTFAGQGPAMEPAFRNMLERLMKDNETRITPWWWPF